MKRAWRRAIAALVGLSAAALAAQPRARASIADLAWLAGDWTGGSGDTTIEERWTPAAGGAMLAIARTTKADRMVAFEYLRIVERGGGLVYIAQPQGRPPTEFVLAGLTPDSATFENRAHDYPKVIRYTRRPDGTLEARVGDGGEKWETFEYRRAP